jgi:pimeloyl-ACP methyl ester carboxylesterase
MANFCFKGVEFHYSESGKGPAVIFLHGHLENRHMWKPVTDTLPHSTRWLSLDLPGHGNSGNLGYVHSMDEMAEVVKAFADHKKLRRFILCGHSMGGYVALAFAEKHPDMVKAMILMNSTSKGDSPEKKKARVQAIKMAKSDHKSFIRHTIPMLFRPKHRRGMLDKVREVKREALKTSAQGVVASIEGMKTRPDREVLLHFAPYKILFIAGENDPVLPFDQLRPQLMAPMVEGVVAPNGHMGHLEDPEIVIPAIRKFIAKYS